MAKKAKQYRALTDLHWRKSPPNPDQPELETWWDYEAGDIFVPQPHWDMARCLERGIVEEVDE